MRKVHSNINQAGFTLIEIVIASSILALLVTTFVGALVYAQQVQKRAGVKERAVFLAEEGLEVVRNIRDESFENLEDGDHGLNINGGTWEFSGVDDVVDIYTRQLVIATIDDETREVSSTVTWSGAAGEQEVVLITYLTNWREASGGELGDLIVDTSAADTSGQGNKDLIGITLENQGEDEIVIETMTVSWTEPGKRSRELVVVSFDGVDVWSESGPGSPSGSQESGVNLDIDDIVLASGSGALSLDYLRFDKSIKNHNVTITFFASGGLQKTITVEL